MAAVSKEKAKEIAGLKKLLNVARGTAVNFGACLGSRPDGFILMLDRSKTPRSLATLAKARSDTTKAFFGEVEVDGNRARFICDSDPPGGTLAVLRKFFETNKLGFKPEFNRDAAADVKDGADKGRITDADRSPELKAWQKADAQIEAAVRQLMKAKQKPTPKAMSAWKELRKRAARGDVRLATRKAPQVLKLMAPRPAQTQGSGQKGRAQPRKGEMLDMVRKLAQRLRGRMTPEQERYLKAAATQAKRGQDDKAAALLRAAQKLAA